MMVEVDVTVADAALVGGLVRSLRCRFDASGVSYDPVLKQIRIGCGSDSGGAPAVVEAVERWIEFSGAAVGLLAVGTTSYTLVGSGPEAHVIDSARDAGALAAISAVLRSVEGADDSVTLLRRLSESISFELGFERVGIASDFAESGLAAGVATHGWSRHELMTLAASDELQAIRGGGQGTPVLAHVQAAGPGGQSGALVVVPLGTGGRFRGVLLADHGGTAFELDGRQRALLSTLGTLVSLLHEKAVAYSDLLHAGELKTDFIALASHELRTPSTAVCGIAETLHERGDGLSADTRRRVFEVLYEQGQRLGRLIEQLLDLSRLEAPSLRIAPAQLAVRETTAKIVRGVAAARADEIEIRIDPALVMRVDAEAFERIVSNLITNALRYGRGPIAVSASKRDRHFRLAVEDRGPGVSPELVPRLFDRFVRGDSPAKAGAGLGLSIARDYAHAHGGELLFQNATPHGARFELVVPIDAGARQAETLR
jgi:signal transduction histidine kinase